MKILRQNQILIVLFIIILSFAPAGAALDSYNLISRLQSHSNITDRFHSVETIRYQEIIDKIRPNQISYSDEEITSPIVLYEPLELYAIQNTELYPPVEMLWITTAPPQGDIGQIIHGLKNNKPEIPFISG